MLEKHVQQPSSNFKVTTSFSYCSVPWLANWTFKLTNQICRRPGFSLIDIVWTTGLKFIVSGNALSSVSSFSLLPPPSLSPSLPPSDLSCVQQQSRIRDIPAHRHVNDGSKWNTNDSKTRESAETWRVQNQTISSQDEGGGGTHTHTHIHTHMHTHMHTHIHTHVHTHTCTHTHTHIHTYTHIHTHTYTHYTHTRTHVSVFIAPKLSMYVSYCELVLSPGVQQFLTLCVYTHS